MTVRIDLDKKEISLGVKDLVFSEISSVGIAVENNLSIRAALGRSLHSESQNSHKASEPTYVSEFTIKYKTEILNFNVAIHGRIDGIYEKDNEIVIEEIKSVFNKNIYMVFGGFHLLQKSGIEMKIIIDDMKAIGVVKCGATHCTGVKQTEMIKEAFGNNFIELGVGNTIVLN